MIFNVNKNSSSNINYFLDDNITISKGGQCVLRHRSSRPPTHTLTSLSRTDPLHTLPLTALLSPGGVSRCWLASSILLERVLHFPAQRACEQAARGEGGCLLRSHV